MSFVYADHINERIAVYCDTKLTVNDSIASCISREQLALIERFGIIKTTIICPEIMISFAGNIFLATKLFYRLFDMKRFTVQDVVSEAARIHMANPNDIEFIIAGCEDRHLELHYIKDHEIHKNCQVAWLGSYDSFRLFQQMRNSNGNSSAKAYKQTATAFLDTVQSGLDNTVGGFPVSAGYRSDLMCFCYDEKVVLQSEKFQNVKLGDSIKFYTAAEDGGFSFEQIPISCEEMILRIDQIEEAILYTRSRRINKKDIDNIQLFSLMLPIRMRKDERLGWIRC